MPESDDALAQYAEWERLSTNEAAAIAERGYGIRPDSIERLETERDDSFGIRVGKQLFTLKVAHPLDGADAVDLQTQALRHIETTDPGLPIPRELPQKGSTGTDRIVRLLTWVPGLPMFLSGNTPDQLKRFGATLGRLAKALEGFEHPAERRYVAWDAGRMPALRPLLDAVDDPNAEWFLDRFETDALPRLDAVPHQVIHNDFHPGNVLVDAAAPDFVTGILDFGDIVHTARVVDLGVAINYLIVPGEPLEPSYDAVLSGYESVNPLAPEERDLIPDLIAARLVQRILIGTVFGHDVSKASGQLASFLPLLPA